MEKEMYNTEEITCPNCLEEIGDSWEACDEGVEICSNCGCEYSYEREVVVTYSSKIVKKGNKFAKGLLNSKVNLSMFFPCDEDGNIFEKSFFFTYDDRLVSVKGYEDALGKVIFKTHENRYFNKEVDLQFILSKIDEGKLVKELMTDTQNFTLSFYGEELNKQYYEFYKK